MRKRLFTYNSLLPVLLLVALLCSPGPGKASTAAGAPETKTPCGSVTLSSRLAGGRIGDPVPFIIRISLADGVRLDEGALTGFKLRPDRLPPELYRVRITIAQPRAKVNPDIITLRGTLVIYAPGTYQVHTTRLVGHRQDENGKTVLVEFPATALVGKIASLQPEIATSAVSLVIPRRDPPLPPQPQSHPGQVAAASYTGILCLLAALFCSLGLYLNRRSLKVLPESDSSGRLPGKTPRRQLQKLLQPATDNNWSALVAIDHQLRYLLGEEMKLAPGAVGGCGETFARRLSQRLAPEKGRELVRIYAEIDHLVSRERAGQKQVAALKKRLGQWLEQQPVTDGPESGEEHGV